MAFQLDFEDLISPLPVDRFLDEYWGKKMYATALCEDMLTVLSVAFHDGNLGECAGACRRDDNSHYNEDDIQGFEDSLKQHKAVILPFCFTQGAMDIKNAFIKACSGFGNDIEVGMYFSQVGCEPAQWHCDPNHNITIQLSGEKDWLHAPGNPHTLGAARGLKDAPLNYLDQTLPFPATDPARRHCQNLRPGSVLYIPPGHWHSVVPVSGNCVSVNLRVANIVQAKWICEAMFAHLMKDLRSSEGSYSGVCPADISFGPLSSDMRERAKFAASSIETSLASNRMPRCFPFQPEHSDGLRLGAHLDHLVEQGFAIKRASLQNKGIVAINPLVSIIPKLRDHDCLVLDLRSVSSLTGSDYLRFSLICESTVQEAVNILVAEGKAPIADLKKVCQKADKGSESQPQKKKRKKTAHTTSSRGSATAEDSLISLICILLHANVLYIA